MWGIQVQRDAESSLSRQIYASLRTSILGGQIGPGEALPSTRALAKELAVSRNTVIEAYEMLLAEGFVESRQGAPTRVVEGLNLPEGQSLGTREDPPGRGEPRRSLAADFRTGKPDLALFPWALWCKTLREAVDALPPRELGYTGAQGYAPLRVEIARWLFRSRSIVVDSEDIFVTAGATHALYLLVDLLHEPDRAFVLESPSHPATAGVLTDRGYAYRTLPVDELGADVDALNPAGVSAIYVTPSHQYPLGGVLPATRRTALLRMAEESDFYIIEDDYDSEFRYAGAPISPICALDAARTIYVGTFSKSLFPALRVGFVVLPKGLQAEWKRRRTFLDVQNPIVEQATLAAFLRRRRMDRHVQHMRRIYAQRRQVLITALADSFGSQARPWGDASGLHLALQFPGVTFGQDYVRQCAAEGIYALPLAYACPSEGRHADKLLLGYGHLEPQRIRRGIELLRRLLVENGYIDAKR